MSWIGHVASAPAQLRGVDDWTPQRRGWGSYLFIYLFWPPLCLSLSSKKPCDSRESLVAVTPTLEGGMIKGSLGRLGKTSPPRMDNTACEKVIPTALGQQITLLRSNNMKGQNLATVAHIHVFLSNKGKWETPATAEHPSYHSRGGGGQGYGGKSASP